MAHSRMLPAVIQTVILCGLSAIISHHLVNNAFEDAGKTELWLNITTTLERVNNASMTTKPALNSTTISNATTLLNTTSNSFPTNGTTSTSSSGESFYWHTFPRDMFIMALIAPLYYYWQLWLERILPARTRPEARPPPPEKTDFGDGDDREQEVIEKWITQGKIQRSSLSWWNTFLKWSLNCTIGSLWCEAEVIFRFVGSFFSIHPLASLIGFILVPAHKRLTFEAGADFFWSLFWGIALTTVLPMIASNSYVQYGVAMWIESMENQTRDGRPPQPFPRLGDEL